MKIRTLLLWTFLPLVTTKAQDVVSVEQFSKIKDQSAREKIISSAPASQREELERVNQHLVRITQYPGENLKVARERIMVKARGFEHLDHLILSYRVMWRGFLSDNFTAMKSEEPDLQRQADRAKLIDQEFDKYALDEDPIHAMVVNLAPSPGASELEAKADKLFKIYIDRGIANDKPKDLALEKQQLIEANKQVGEIIDQLKSLPVLPSAQVQKEYDGVPEEKVPILPHT